MSNAAQKETFVPRSNLQRTLKYRPHLKWQYYATMALASVLTIGSFLVYGADQSELRTQTLIASAFLFLQSWFLIRPLAFMSVQVFLDKLIVDKKGVRTEIKYSDILDVKFSYVPYLGGWFSIITAEKNYKFTAVLERSEYVLEAIASFNPNLIPVSNLESYRRTSISVDHSWSYMTDKLTNWKHLVLKYAVMPIVVGSAFSLLRYMKNGSFGISTTVNLAGAYFIVQASLAAVAYLVVSSMLIAKGRQDLIQNPNFTARNKVYEEKIERRSQLIQTVLIAAVFSFVAFYLMVR